MADDMEGRGGSSDPNEQFRRPEVWEETEARWKRLDEEYVRMYGEVNPEDARAAADEIIQEETQKRMKRVGKVLVPGVSAAFVTIALIVGGGYLYDAYQSGGSETTPVAPQVGKAPEPKTSAGGLALAETPIPIPTKTATPLPPTQTPIPNPLGAETSAAATPDKVKEVAAKLQAEATAQAKKENEQFRQADENARAWKAEQERLAKEMPQINNTPPPNISPGSLPKPPSSGTHPTSSEGGVHWISIVARFLGGATLLGISLYLVRRFRGWLPGLPRFRRRPQTSNEEVGRDYPMS